MNKKKLRQDFLDIRTKLAKKFVDECSRKVQQNLNTLIETHFENSPEKSVKKIFTYYPFKNEIDVFTSIKNLDEDIEVYLPRCKPEREMTFHKVGKIETLEKDKYGILAPSEKEPTGQLCSNSLLLIPCVAASKEGYRVGYGAGYYDRYLAREGSKIEDNRKICVVYDQFLTSEKINDSWDEKFGVIITESETIIVGGDEQ
jgi:5-formyltetrahydrofolate cyclo-ligase